MSEINRAMRQILAAWRSDQAMRPPGTETIWAGACPLTKGFDWSVLDRALTDSTLEPSMLRLVGAQGRVSEDEFVGTVHRGGIANRELLLDRLRQQLIDGATLTVNGVDRIAAPIRQARELLEYAVATRAWCNAFISHSEESSFGKHTDRHHTLVVQGAGTKRWRVFDPITDQVVHECLLDTGDVLHVPAGWPHEVAGTGEPSLHWTFGWVEESEKLAVLADVERRVRSGAFADDGLQHAFSGDWTAAVAEARDRIRATSSLRRAGASLPWLLEPSSIDQHSAQVRWAARLPPLVSETDDVLIVETLGKRLTLDRRLSPVMRRLSTGEAVPAVQLTTEEADASIIGAFLAWGVQQDVLIIEFIGQEEVGNQ